MAATASSGPQTRGSLQKLLVAAFWGASIILLCAIPSHAGVKLQTKADIFITGFCFKPDILGYGSTRFGEINVLDVPLLKFTGISEDSEFARLQGFAVPLFKDNNTNETSVTLSGALVFGKNSTTFPAGTRLNIEGTFEVPANTSAVNTDIGRDQLTSAASIVGGTGPLRSARGFVVLEKLSFEFDDGYFCFKFYVFLSGNGLFVPGAAVE